MSADAATLIQWILHLIETNNPAQTLDQPNTDTILRSPKYKALLESLKSCDPKVRRLSYCLAALTINHTHQEPPREFISLLCSCSIEDYIFLNLLNPYSLIRSGNLRRFRPKTSQKIVVMNSMPLDQFPDGMYFEYDIKVIENLIRNNQIFKLPDPTTSLLWLDNSSIPYRIFERLKMGSFEFEEDLQEPTTQDEAESAGLHHNARHRAARPPIRARHQDVDDGEVYSKPFMEKFFSQSIEQAKRKHRRKSNFGNFKSFKHRKARRGTLRGHHHYHESPQKAAGASMGLSQFAKAQNTPARNKFTEALRMEERLSRKRWKSVADTQKGFLKRVHQANQFRSITSTQEEDNHQDSGLEGLRSSRRKISKFGSHSPSKLRRIDNRRNEAARRPRKAPGGGKEHLKVGEAHLKVGEALLFGFLKKAGSGVGGKGFEEKLRKSWQGGEKSGSWGAGGGLKGSGGRAGSLPKRGRDSKRFSVVKHPGGDERRRSSKGKRRLKTGLISGSQERRFKDLDASIRAEEAPMVPKFLKKGGRVFNDFEAGLRSGGSNRSIERFKGYTNTPKRSPNVGSDRKSQIWAKTQKIDSRRRTLISTSTNGTNAFGKGFRVQRTPSRSRKGSRDGSKFRKLKGLDFVDKHHSGVSRGDRVRNTSPAEQSRSFFMVAKRKRRRLVSKA